MNEESKQKKVNLNINNIKIIITDTINLIENKDDVLSFVDEIYSHLSRELIECEIESENPEND